MENKSVKMTLRNGTKFTWQLGVGPCGRTVTSLSVQCDTPGAVVIVQQCDDSPTPDFFLYPLDTIASVICYTTDNPNPAKEQNNELS